jgi:hypothetical protein
MIELHRETFPIAKKPALIYLRPIIIKALSINRIYLPKHPMVLDQPGIAGTILVR